MGGAGFPLATQKAGGGGAVETDEPAPLGGVHRLQGSSYRLLEHSGRRALAPLQRFFPGLEFGGVRGAATHAAPGLGGGLDGFHVQ